MQHFQALSIGTTFWFRGESWVKVHPRLAHTMTGEYRVFDPLTLVR